MYVYKKKIESARFVIFPLIASHISITKMEI